MGGYIKSYVVTLISFLFSVFPRFRFPFLILLFITTLDLLDIDNKPITSCVLIIDILFLIVIVFTVMI